MRKTFLVLAFVLASLVACGKSDVPAPERKVPDGGPPYQPHTVPAPPNTPDQAPNR